MTRPVLYSYWRSSASYRVRIALNLKGIAYETRPVHLVRGGGEQKSPEYLAVNPQGLVPSFEEDGLTITQSLAIIDYLEDTRPGPALLPSDAAGRARVRSLALIVACDVHPLNNSGVLRFLTDELGVDDDGRRRWYRNWIERGFSAMEARLAGDRETGRFCHGDEPGLADLFLVPQVYNAERFHCDLSAFPTIRRITSTCLELETFSEATPEAQPDAE
jgi:maleylacetoacetate isomerase